MPGAPIYLCLRTVFGNAFLRGRGSRLRGGSQAWPTARDLGSRPEGVPRFESWPPHLQTGVCAGNGPSSQARDAREPSRKTTGENPRYRPSPQSLEDVDERNALQGEFFPTCIGDGLLLRRAHSKGGQRLPPGLEHGIVPSPAQARHELIDRVEAE